MVGGRAYHDLAIRTEGTSLCYNAPSIVSTLKPGVRATRDRQFNPFRALKEDKRNQGVHPLMRKDQELSAGRNRERGSSSSTVLLVVLAVGVVLALGFVGGVIFFGKVSSELPELDPAQAENSGQEGPVEEVQSSQMPDRSRTKTALEDAANARQSGEEQEMGPIPGWTLEASLTAIQEALADLSGFNEDTDPREINIAIQRLTEQKDLAVPAIDELLSSMDNVSFGGGLSIVENSMQIVPDLKVALMEALRRIDSNQSHSVLSGLLSNAEDVHQAGYAVWMLQHSNADSPLFTEALESAAYRLLGPDATGTEDFTQLAPSRWIVSALREHPNAESIRGLARLARESTNDILVREAERALAASGEVDAVSAMMSSFRFHSAPQERHKKARLLGSSHGGAIMQPLRDMLLDRSMDESERAAMVAGMADYPTIVDRQARLASYQAAGRDREFDGELRMYRSDLDSRIDLLDQLMVDTGTNTSLGTHAQIAKRRLETLRDNLNEVTIKQPD